MIFRFTFLALLLVSVPITANASRIHEAVYQNDVELLRKILSENIAEEVNAVTGDNVTALHLAAAEDNVEMMQMLLKAGADVNAKTSGGFTPLHWAASKNCVRSAELLTVVGADVNAASEHGVTPLHWAAYRNSTEMVNLLIKSGADISVKTDEGFTPLHWAIRNDSTEVSMILSYVQAEREIEKEEAKETKETGEQINISSKGIPLEIPTGIHLKERQTRKHLAVNIGGGCEMEFVWIPELGIWMGKHEVTNAQFRRFDSGHRSITSRDFDVNKDDQPVVYVSWFQAKAFCDWANKEYANRLPKGFNVELPSEKDWCTAARCGDERKYPWGNDWPPRYGNFCDYTARKNMTIDNHIRGYDDGYTVTAPVSESGANEWGLYGMAGNAWEWCEDWYDRSATYKVRKGGSWDFDNEFALRIESKGFDLPSAQYDTIGFRVILRPDNPSEAVIGDQ